MGLGRALATGLGLIASLACGLGATWLLRDRPWDLVATPADEGPTMVRDAFRVDEALAQVPPGHATGPDVLVIVLDTVGARYLDLYGYPHPTMPRLTERARRGRIWNRAIAESPWTLPSHASLFTGLHPTEHGADGRLLSRKEMRDRSTHGRKAANWDPSILLERPLPDGAHTLAERLQEAGYVTVGVSANKAFLHPYWNLHQGFDAWVCDQLGAGASHLPYTRGDRITAAVLHAVDALAPVPGSRFLFVNYMDAHVPYVPRDGFVRNPEALLARFRSGKSHQDLVDRVLAREIRLPEAVRAAWLQAYESELRFLDAALDDLLSALERKGFLERGYVVVTSDHGEYFGEHDLLEHSKDLYQPALEIPLVVWGPGITPGRTDDPVQLGDVYRWTLGWAGVPVEAEAERSASDLVVSELHGSRYRDLFSPNGGERFNRVRRAFFRGGRKVILGSDESFEAYDVVADPEETRNLASETWARELRYEGEVWSRTRRPIRSRRGDAAPEPGGDGEEKVVWERLRGMGYVE